MPETEKLRDMIDSIINNDEKKAESDFHDYSKVKMKNLVQGTEDLLDPTVINKNKNDE